MPASKVKSSVKTVKPVSPAKADLSSTPKSGGLSLSVYSLKGEKKGSVTLSKEVFGARVNPSLMAQAVRVYLVNQRQGNASTKTRGEIHASTKKIYRQKGTGRARHGAISAPIFVGGGVALGPHPRIFELKLSKAMKRKALFSALSEKLSANGIFVVDVDQASGKTKEIAGLLKTLNVLNKKDSNILFIAGDKTEAKKAARNIRGVIAEAVHSLNTFTVLNSKSLVFAKDAVEKIESIYLKKLA